MDNNVELHQKKDLDKTNSEHEHTWQAELDEIQLRQQYAEKLGGEKNIKRQHDSGKLTSRERIHSLLDEGSFHEYGALTGKANYDQDGNFIDSIPSNIVIGKGKIKKQKVVVSADDFTVRGGSSEAASPEKMVFAENLALDLQAPLIRLVDAAGGSIRLLEKNQSTKIPGYAQWNMAEMMGQIPVIGVALGPCAGLGALRVVASHFSVMVKGTSQVFAAGPQVVAPGVKENVTKEELGGSQVHVHKSGAVHNEAKDEYDALNQVKKFLSYLPSNIYKLPARIPSSDPIDRCEDELASIIPRDKRKVYKMRKVLELIFDKDSLFEMRKHYGRSTITMFGRINGYPVGIMANDPYIYGGSMSAESAEKIENFVDLCDTFHLPIVNLVDQPGVSIGSQAEAKGTIKKAIRAMMTLSQVNIPWSTVFIRRSFGVAGAAYAPRGRANVRYAWPSAHWGSIPVEGGVEAAFRKELGNAEDPEQKLKDLIDYYKRFESPLRTAERFGIEEMIDPRRTRPILAEWVEEAYDQLPQLVGPRGRTMRI
ncbi:acyl-CoA carboxylase subunit beta [Mesobacillus harenae]|uniref:acyl-CoA carboxylase subunit beta n=1 Tax=Mesobacillus harenae TaxID=2213203 RepID=UPI00157FECF9|nr:carboxyl transferase domain-containing protein [Mesobacillus harenae]